MSIMNTFKATIARAIARAIAPHITSALPSSSRELKAEIDSLKGEIERLALHSRDEEEFRGEVALIADDHCYSKEEIITIISEEIDLEEAIDDHGLVTGWEANERAEEAISEWVRDDLKYAVSEEGFLTEVDVREIIADRAEEIRSEISDQLKAEISDLIGDQIKAERLKRFELKAEISELKAELRAEIDRPWWRRLF